MSQIVDFATFCHKGDIHRLHTPGQLEKQVMSNRHWFDRVIIVYQGVDWETFNDFRHLHFPFLIKNRLISNDHHIDTILWHFGIDTNKDQYISMTDQAHRWKYHVVNHLAAIEQTHSDYIVFADNDCWMVKQPKAQSWVNRGIEILENDPTVFIVSPNDGEPERKTMRFSQQMFMARTAEFRGANFNQPNWDGNVNIPGGPMPEYWAMLEGRMELHCRQTGQYRYVLGAEFRYWHFNKLTEDDLFETDLSKY